MDEELFERRRPGILNRQANLRLQLDETTMSPDELIARVQEVLNLRTSLPQHFENREAVRRRQSFHAVCANATVRGRKALYKAKGPFSFFEGQGSTRDWQAILEHLRTWVVQHPQFPEFPIFTVPSQTSTAA